MGNFFRTIGETGTKIGKKIGGDNISIFASQATFFLLLSFFPFLTFLLTLLQYIPIDYNTEFIKSIVNSMPSEINALLEGVVGEIEAKANGAVLSVSVILFLWSASNGMLALKTGLDQVDGEKGKRNYFYTRFICTLYTLLLVIVIIFTMVLMVFGTSIARFVESNLPSFIDATRFILSMRFLFSGVLLMLFFLMLYTLLPHTKKNFFTCLPGAIICTAGWLGFSFIFGIYVSNFSNFSYMYGSLAAIVISMLWLRVLMTIFFFGAEANFAFRTPEVRLMFAAAFMKIFKRKGRYDNAKLIQKRKKLKNM